MLVERETGTIGRPGAGRRGGAARRHGDAPRRADRGGRLARRCQGRHGEGRPRGRTVAHGGARRGGGADRRLRLRVRRGHGRGHAERRDRPCPGRRRFGSRRRALAVAELRPGGSGDPRHRVRGRRLHGDALAGHDRRLATRCPAARRRASAVCAPLCGRHRGVREARRCRRLARDRLGERRRAHVSARLGPCSANRQVAGRTTHAAAAALGGVAYVIGGRGAAVGTPTARIVAIDPRTRRIRAAGLLEVSSLRPCGGLPRRSDPAGGRSWQRRHGVNDRRASTAGRRRGASGAATSGPLHLGRERLRLRRPRHAHRRSASRPTAGLRAELEERHGRRDRPAHPPGRRALRGRRPSAARRAGLGSPAPLRHERRRQQPDADRSPHGQARGADPGRGPVQHVLLSRRALRDRRRRAAPPAGLPRPAHLRAPALARSAVPRRRPHGLQRGPALPRSRAASSPGSWSSSASGGSRYSVRSTYPTARRGCRRT